jgi:hypothetical protein
MRMKRLRKMVEDLARVGREHAWDLTAGAGLVLLAIGLWMAWPPLCPLVVGSVGVALGLWGARAWSRQAPPPGGQKFYSVAPE